MTGMLSSNQVVLSGSHEADNHWTSIAEFIQAQVKSFIFLESVTGKRLLAPQGHFCDYGTIDKSPNLLTVVNAYLLTYLLMCEQKEP